MGDRTAHGSLAESVHGESTQHPSPGDDLLRDGRQTADGFLLVSRVGRAHQHRPSERQRGSAVRGRRAPSGQQLRHRQSALGRRQGLVSWRHPATLQVRASQQAVMLTRTGQARTRTRTRLARTRTRTRTWLTRTRTKTRTSLTVTWGGGCYCKLQLNLQSLSSNNNEHKVKVHNVWL